jgi:lipopolysaccharide export system protein LptA
MYFSRKMIRFYPRWAVWMLFGIQVTFSSPAQESKPTTVEITYATAVYDFSGEQKKVTLEGPITISTESLKVTCNHAEVISSRKQDATSQSNVGAIDYILATGDVIIEQLGTRALAGKAEIFPAERKLVLEDEPKIVDEYGIVSGYRITFLQGKRNIKIESGPEQERSRIQLNDVEDIDFLMGETPADQ